MNFDLDRAFTLMSPFVSSPISRAGYLDNVDVEFFAWKLNPIRDKFPLADFILPLHVHALPPAATK